MDVANSHLHIISLNFWQDVLCERAVLDLSITDNKPRNWPKIESNLQTVDQHIQYSIKVMDDKDTLKVC